MRYRPVAVPLVTVDPFFSIWSCADALYSSPTEHWCGKSCPLITGIYVGDNFYSMGAFEDDGRAIRHRVYQTDLTITPTSSIYTFENNYAKVELTFTSPLLLDRLDILTRPVSYVKYKIESKCDQPIRFVFGISSRACVNSKGQQVEFKKTDFSLCCGNISQSPLSQSGDNVMIDWGYLHLCDKNAVVANFIDNTSLRLLPMNRIYDAFGENPYLLVTREDNEGVITLAYDEIYPIEYFGVKLREYYTKHFDSFGEMVSAAIKEYDEIKKLFDKFDTELTAECAKLGENYQKIITLAYRQAIAAHKLVEDTEGNIVFLSKECDSNGCIGTLDVTYPSIPLFLKYCPELVKGMLRPIIKYAKSEDWTFDFAPHDVGQYPIANGQVYGSTAKPIDNTDIAIKGKLSYERQMPVEESGNMLLCLAAVKKYSGGDISLFDADRELMKKWADYLVQYGYDPEDQLCTDDFAGHLARNCNLSLKAILGIAAYSDLSGDTSYLEIAKNYAKRWETDAKANHTGTRLTFDNADSWSLKYNLIWDSLLGYNVFSDEVKKDEIDVYRSKLNRYGVPLDNRSDYTKIDWLIWTTRITDDKEYFDLVCQSIMNMINESPDRVPLTDWYYTSTAAHRAFKNRTVVGGLFINLI